ncbi:MAG: hypothetical protein HYV48_04235 [Candidatus Omnitrophica bacterium]|nr:hypothetical protein [Candidatus Omnitrophota bacterium]
MNSMLNDIQKKRLLEIARASIENYIRNTPMDVLREDDPELLEEMGAFVTITLRG